MLVILDKIMSKHWHQCSFAHAVLTQLGLLYFKILSSPIENVISDNLLFLL